MEGYRTKYENVGKYEDITDRCYDGGKIINYKIPKTGDAVNLPLVIAMAVFSALGLILLGALEKRQRARKR